MYSEVGILLLGLFDDKFIHILQVTMSEEFSIDRTSERSDTRQLVSRPITKRCVERLEVKNCSRSKCRVFVAILGDKLCQNNQFLRNLCLWMVNSCLIIKYETNFSVLCGKCSQDAEVSELCGSAPLHPVRCPV